MENLRKEKFKGKLNYELKYNLVFKNRITFKKGQANYKSRNSL